MRKRVEVRHEGLPHKVGAGVPLESMAEPRFGGKDRPAPVEEAKLPLRPEEIPPVGGENGSTDIWVPLMVL